MNGYNTKSQTAIGIDPGLANTGYAIVTRNPRGQFRILESGCITTDKKAPTSTRIATIYTQISDLLAIHAPDIMAVEEVFWNRNPSSCLSTAGISYICLLAAEQAKIVSLLVSPQKAKSFATGSGRASKEQVKRFIEKLTGEHLTHSHAADAAAVGIAGLMQLRIV